MLLLDLRSLTWKAVVGGQDRAINHILSRFYAADGWWQQQQSRLLQVPLQKTFITVVEVFCGVFLSSSNCIISSILLFLSVSLRSSNKRSVFLRPYWPFDDDGGCGVRRAVPEDTEIESETAERQERRRNGLICLINQMILKK